MYVSARVCVRERDGKRKRQVVEECQTSQWIHRVTARVKWSNHPLTFPLTVFQFPPLSPSHVLTSSLFHTHSHPLSLTHALTPSLSHALTRSHTLSLSLTLSISSHSSHLSRPLSIVSFFPTNIKRVLRKIW